jgi:uncharacterized membrane protein
MMGVLQQEFLAQVFVVLGLLVLCVLGYRAIALFRQDARGMIHREEDALLPFREALDAGEIDREEFDRVREALERQRTSAPPKVQTTGLDSGAAPSEVETPSVDPF